MSSLIVLSALASNVVPTEVATDCGDPFFNGVGPYDYNDTEARNNPSKIPMVEKYHFTAKVERLTSGESQVDPGGDLDYTLRAVPNHHRALYAVAKYYIRKGETTQTKWYSARCYFERAARFNSEDGVVHLLFGLYFAMNDQHDRAIEKYKIAEKTLPGSAELQYNLGLSLAEVGRLDEAVAAAKAAYDGGYPLPGLRAKLARLGYDF